MTTKTGNIKYVMELALVPILGGTVAYLSATCDGGPETPAFDFSHRDGTTRKLYLWERFDGPIRVEMADTNRDGRLSYGDDMRISKITTRGPRSWRTMNAKAEMEENNPIDGEIVMDEDIFFPASSRKLIFGRANADEEAPRMFGKSLGCYSNWHQMYNVLYRDAMNARKAKRSARDFSARKRKR